VVVFEDRAQVSRHGSGEFSAGQISLRIRDVAPVIADRTLQAMLLKAPNGTRVSDVRVERDFRTIVDRDNNGEEGVEKRLREVSAEVETLRFTEATTRNQLTLVHQMAEKALADLTADVAWGKPAPDAWRRGLEDLSDREGELRRQLLDLQAQIEAVTEMQADLERQSRALDRPDRRMTAEIVAELVVPTRGEFELELAYVVPNACWRPTHTARIEGADGGQTVTFLTEGCVWQNCGEDWHDVQLQFSTQRPSLGFEPPLLGEDILVTREKPEKVVLERRDQAITTTGLGRATEETDELPGIDDAGVPLTVAASHSASIPSDGMPYRVKIAEFTSAATAELVAIAELNPCALTKVTLKNEGSFPILAGPVELVRDHGFVGRTPVLYVAPGERFQLGFGPDPAVRVRRKVAEVEHELTALSRFVTTERSVTLLLCNIGDETKRLELTERIPVSEVEQVAVEFDASESTAASKPDEDGFIKWSVELPPGGRETVLIKYKVKKRKDVEFRL
jgi:uncharacterized protein (TIGR02231 family)